MHSQLPQDLEAALLRDFVRSRLTTTGGQSRALSRIKQIISEERVAERVDPPALEDVAQALPLQRRETEVVRIYAVEDAS